MKDPNWRRRDRCDYKSEPNHPSDTHHEAPEQTSHRLDMRSSEDFFDYHSSNDSEPDSWGKPPTEPNLVKGQNISAQRAESEHVVNSAVTASAGICGLTMNRPIEGTDISMPLSVIHLIPLYNSQHQSLEESTRGAPFDVVRIQRLNNTLDESQLNPTDELNTQLIAALQAATQTPRTIRHHSQIPTAVTRSRSSRPLKHEKSNETLLRDLAITDTGPLKGYVKADRESTESSETKNRRTSTVLDHQHQRSSSLNSNIAFKKMLRKLHRRTAHISAKESHSSQDDTAGHCDSLPLGSEVSMRAERRDLRNTDSSDASCGSDPSNRTWSTKATSISSSHFNPRAREFLSFSRKEPEIPEEFQHQKFRRLPIADLFKKPEDVQPANVSTISTSEDQPLLEQGTCPQSITTLPDPSNDVLTSFLGHLIQAGSNPLSMYPPLGAFPSMFSAWSPGQVPSLLMPGAVPLMGMPPPPAATLPKASMYDSSGLQPVPPANQLPSCYSAPKASTSGLSGPSQSQQAGFGTKSSRCYVPKPRKPDPGDQLAYEAWIEWRKANEPGYAMECKMRQKRRAQRMMVSPSGPNTQD